MNIEITNVCNFQCSFCPEVERSKDFMSERLFETVIQNVSRVTKLVTFHLMGEPLLHPKLSRFVEICDGYKVKIFLVTNGMLLNERIEDLLLHPAFRQINFSLHSFQDNFPGKDPVAYLEKIFSFTEKAFEKRPTLFINYRLWNLQTPKGQSKENESILKKIQDRFGTAISGVPDTQKKKNHIIKKYLSLHYDTEFTWPGLHLPVLGTTGTCYGLNSHFGVLVDGTVVPCCLDKEGQIPLGNLNSTPLLEILKGPKAKAILTGFNRQELIDPLCQRCQYIERFESSKFGSL